MIVEYEILTISVNEDIIKDITNKIKEEHPDIKLKISYVQDIDGKGCVFRGLHENDIALYVCINSDEDNLYACSSKLGDNGVVTCINLCQRTLDNNFITKDLLIKEFNYSIVWAERHLNY